MSTRLTLAPDTEARALARDAYRCRHCGYGPENSSWREDRLEIDHIVSRYRGGLGTLDNLQVLCRRCHARKTRFDMFWYYNDRRRQKRSARAASLRSRGASDAEVFYATYGAFGHPPFGHGWHDPIEARAWRRLHPELAVEDYPPWVRVQFARTRVSNGARRRQSYRPCSTDRGLDQIHHRAYGMLRRNEGGLVWYVVPPRGGYGRRYRHVTPSGRPFGIRSSRPQPDRLPRHYVRRVSETDWNWRRRVFPRSPHRRAYPNGPLVPRLRINHRPYPGHPACLMS